MQCRLAQKYRLTAAEAQVLRDSGIPIMCMIAPDDNSMKTHLQLKLCEQLRAKHIMTSQGHMGFMTDVLIVDQMVSWMQSDAVLGT